MPVGGGGLISGVAIALKTQLPEVEVIGVQVETCAPFPASLQAGAPLAVQSALTIADGIAVKRPGELTLALIKRWVDEIVVVSEDEVAEAMVFLLERAKLVVEGAGAVGVAALLAGRLPSGASSATTVAILSGGNVDAGLLADVARRHETQAGRRIVLLARLPDRPGALAQLLSLVADRGANLLDVQHIREGVDLHVRETAVQLVLETRSLAHAEEVIEAVREGGYAAGLATTESRVLRDVRACSDERTDDAAVLVGLGMPLDAEHELARRGLDRLGQLVERREPGHHEAVADRVDSLMVVGLGPV